ncbi:MAG: ribonuclease J [Campylobacterota bacterium]
MENKTQNQNQEQNSQNSQNTQAEQPNRQPRPQTNSNQPNNNTNKPHNNNRPGNGGKKKFFSWHKDIKKAIKANDRVNESRLNTSMKINTKTNAKVRYTPLGGLGEIGGNIAVLETQNSAVIIDVGMSFPDEEMHGVDILVPDFSYLHAIKDKIAGIVITHAHEDHIGAVPYLFKQLQFPIYGTPLPLGMLANKFDEHKMREHKKYFRYVEKRRQIKIGEFTIEFMHITHSIPDASALAIQTEAGTIIHTGDFKIDHTPIDGNTTDLHRFAHYGEKGVLMMMSDSTNSYNPGVTKSESVVGKTFDGLFEKTKGRVIMSTFSSNVHRVYQAIERGVKHGRKVAVIGRSMERNLSVAMELGYIKLPQDIFVDAHEVGKYADEEILIVTTGSQGEPMSALFRMATDEHRHIKLKPSDTVILSARAIPGNEGSVSKVINHIQKAGATVVYQEFSEIHVSGHGAQEEQKLLLRLCQPKFFLPVHGEYNHINKHAQTATECGIDKRNIFLMSDGDQMEISPKYLKKVKTIKCGKVYIDNQVNQKIEHDVVVDRQKLANEGIVNIIVQIGQQSKKLEQSPIVTTYGIIGKKQQQSFNKTVENTIESVLLKFENGASQKVLEDNIRSAVRKQIVKSHKRYPLIVPTVFMV